MAQNKYFPAKQKKYEEYRIHFPQLTEVAKLISDYQPLTPDLNLDLIEKSGKSYYKEYRDNDYERFLYFGEHDSQGQRSGKGVLVTPNKIL